MWVEENILHNPQVSRVLNESFIYAEMWVERGSEGERVLKALNIGEALPQYAIVDAEGSLIVHFDRNQTPNVASMTPASFTDWLKKGLGSPRVEATAK